MTVSDKDQQETLQVLAESSDAYLKKAQLAYVGKNGFNIMYINKPSEEVQIAAVTEVSHSIGYIRQPCIEAQRIAVETSPLLVGCIQSPAKEILELSVSLNPKAIYFAHFGFHTSSPFWKT